MATVNVVKRSRPNKDGRHPLQLKITKNARSIRINMGHSVLPKEWDDKLKKITTIHPNSKRMNNLCSLKQSEATAVILDLEARGDYTLNMVRERVTKSRYKETFFSQADKFFDDLLQNGQFNRYSGEITAIRHLRKFFGNRDIEFEDLTVQKLRDFESWLKARVVKNDGSKMSKSSITHYMITLRAIYNRGISNGYVDRVHYPFGRGKYVIRRAESKKVGLVKEEVQKLEEYEPKDAFHRHAKNVWLFSFYFAGVRASDVLLSRWSNFQNGRYTYEMGKNNKQGSLAIPVKAQAILDIYRKVNADLNDLVFPDMGCISDFHNSIEVQKQLKYRLRKINTALKHIAIDIKLGKPLSMHIARHTFGTIAGDRISVHKLKNLYRHSSITTTVNYQKSFMHESTDGALESVLDF